MPKRERSFIPLFITNYFGTMNDNFLKGLASFIVIDWISDPTMKSVFMGLVAGALVLPFVLCSPLADRLTVIWPKLRVFRLAKWVELPIVALGVIGFASHSAALVVAAVTLMGLQSSLYSPSKYALVRDIGGTDRISTGMGGMEGIAFFGMVSGTIAAALAVDHAPVWVQYAALAVLAAAGLVSSYVIRAEETPNRNIHSVNPVRYFLRVRRMAAAYPGLNAVIVTLSVFWFAAAMLQMGLVVYGKEVMGLDATHTGYLLCGAAVGIVVGQVAAGLVDRRHFLLGATPLTGLLAAVLLAVLFFVPLSPVPFGVLLALLALDFGFFKLPFDAEIQKVVKGPRLNTILSYFNQVSFLFMLVASGVYALVSRLGGPRAFLLVLSVTMFIVSVLFAFSYRSVLVFTGRWLFRRRYRIVGDGLACVTGANAYLVLPNHPAMVDPLLVTTELWRVPLRPLVDELFFRSGFVAPAVLRVFQAVPVPDLRAHRSVQGARSARALFGNVRDTLAHGGSVIFYPSGHIQTEADREVIGTRQLAYNVCRDLPEGVAVIGVRTRGLWGSIWSRAGRKSSPQFVPTLVRSLFLWLFVAPFCPRRRVTMHFENLTDRVRDWSRLTRVEFNRNLEAWYNASGPEEAVPSDTI